MAVSPDRSTDCPVDFDALERAPVSDTPVRHVIVPGFLKAAAQDGVEADYPPIAHPGSFPLPTLKFGPRFDALMRALRGPEMTRLVAEKLGIDLSGRPTTATVRGISRAEDGQIHTDSVSKLVTLLLYMNRDWGSEQGRLRLLNSAHDLNDYAAELPPDRGTLLLFKNGPTAWHGFEPFAGPRRVIQVNWVKSQWIVQREGLRHALSATTKRLFGREAA